MKNRFTQNVSIATAVAMAISGGSILAANKTVTPLQLSSESLTLNAAAAVQSPSIEYTLGQAVDNGDFLVFTLSGATVSGIQTGTDVTCVANGAGGNADFTVHANTTSTVTLRATGRTAVDPAGAVCTIPAGAFELSSASIGSTTATFTSTMQTGTGSVNYDAGSTATALLFASSQFTATSILALDQVIDVEQSRGAFSAGATTDTLVINFANAADKVARLGCHRPTSRWSITRRPSRAISPSWTTRMTALVAFSLTWVPATARSA